MSPSILAEYEKWVAPEKIKHTVKDFPRCIALIGDVHVGARTMDLDKFTEHLKLVKKEKGGIVFMGDALENVTSSSKVAQAGAVFEQFNPDGASPISWQFDAFLELMKGHRVLGMLNGNHEERIRREGLDITGLLADRLGAKNLGVLASIKMGKGSFLVSHGEGAGGKHLEYRMRDYGFHDVVAGGHNHQLSAHVIKQMDKTGYLIRTGSYLRTARYAMTRQYSSANSPTGCVLVHLESDGKPNRVEILT